MFFSKHNIIPFLQLYYSKKDGKNQFSAFKKFKL